MSIRQSRVLENQTISTSGQSDGIPNDGKSAWVLTVRVGSVTGLPIVVFKVEASDDNTTWYNPSAAWTLSAINALGVYRLTFTNESVAGPIVEQYFRVSWSFSGVGSLNNVYVSMSGVGEG